MRRLVLGLGNPILGDDGVGWRVAEAVACRLGPGSRLAEVDCVALGGLHLMERLVGYDDVVLVDALATGEVPVGTVRQVPLDHLPDPTAGHSGSAHDTSLATALAVGKALGADLPGAVTVVAIETAPSYEFGESPSPPVAAAIPTATATVLALLRSEQPVALTAPGEETTHGVT